MAQEQERDDLAGDLGTVTDEEWKEAHEALAAENPGLAATGQLAYVWAPGTEPRGFGVSTAEHDIAPTDEEWEASHGGQ